MSTWKANPWTPLFSDGLLQAVSTLYIGNVNKYVGG